MKTRPRENRITVHVGLFSQKVNRRRLWGGRRESKDEVADQIIQKVKLPWRDRDKTSHTHTHSPSFDLFILVSALLSDAITSFAVTSRLCSSLSLTTVYLHIFVSLLAAPISYRALRCNCKTPKPDFPANCQEQLLSKKVHSYLGCCSSESYWC